MDLALVIATVAGSVAVPLLIAIVAWAVKIQSTLSSFSTSLESVPELWRKANRHERKLSEHWGHIAEMRGRLGLKGRVITDDDDQEDDGP